MLKNLITVALIFIAGSASADGFSHREGIVVDVQPVYSIKHVPAYQEQCYQTQVPVYGQVQAGAGDALAGAIIGGAIGNQFGGGSGKDAMTVLGAIVGANQASRNRNAVIGYTTEVQCQTVQIQEQTQVLDYYEVTYRTNGRYYVTKSHEQFYVGEVIIITK